MTNHSTWRASILFEAERVQLLVKDPTDDVLKAQLPPWTEHPRALLTILEGLSLWSGGRLCAAAYVDERATDCFEQIFYAGGLVEPASPLVTVDVCPRRDRPRRLGGIGDFRQLRLREVGR